MGLLDSDLGLAATYFDDIDINAAVVMDTAFERASLGLAHGIVEDDILPCSLLHQLGTNLIDRCHGWLLSLTSYRVPITQYSSY